MEHLILELGLAIVLMAVASVIASRLHISAVPLLIIIGLAVGPHVPSHGLLDLTFVQSGPIIQFLGRIGVLFLLFYLGLEFSLGRLIRAGRSMATAGALSITVNLLVALSLGWALGWSPREVLVLAGIISVSSSAIVTKLIVDLRRTARPETELIVGITMVEDLFVATYMVLVSGLVLRGSTSIAGMASALVIAGAFLVALLVLGRFGAQRINGWLSTLPEEAFILAVFAILFTIAGVSEVIGVAEALAALLVGLMLAETEHVNHIRRVVVPFRDFFGAFFFFSFGLSINPLSLSGAAGMAITAAALTLAGTSLVGFIISRLARLGPYAGLNVGLTILSRGEYSIVVAGLAVVGGLSQVIQPFTALYVLILSILGPILTKESPRIYALMNSTGAFVRGKVSPAADKAASSPDPPADDVPQHGPDEAREHLAPRDQPGAHDPARAEERRRS